MAGSKIRNMEEFAAVSGISRPTVSKYFNDPNSVRQSTRRKIEDALETYDYRPNIYAINQNRKLTKNIGIIVPYLADPFFAEIARKLEERCIEEGYRPTLYSSHGDPSLEIDILESLRAIKPAGVLMAPLGRSSDKKVLETFCKNVPTVVFDSNIEDLGLSFVGSDNPQFSRLIVDYLCRTGEPPCFFEMQAPVNPNANKRRDSYVAAMQALGHRPEIVKVEGSGWNFEEIGRAGGLRAIETKQFATRTVLCSNDRLAIGLLSACYETGLKIGYGPDHDIRVAGQDDHPFSRFTNPSLTTVAQDYEGISHDAADVLFSTLSGEKTAYVSRLLEGKLIMRKSA